ncbi:hypothetical protein JCM19038_2416 [Geomicrobium sp. JCM 19038]|nr:hypothetical protein JCM19038_2416 [Geomicrobium sp. JCM 19038]
MPEDMQIVDVKEETLEKGETIKIKLAYVIEKGTKDYYLTIHEGPKIHFTCNDIENIPTC